MEVLAEISGHGESKWLLSPTTLCKEICGSLRMILSLLWALEAECMMKVTAEPFSSLFTEPVPAVSDKESSGRSCTWFVHLPAAVSALSVSTCGWDGWSLEHTDGSRCTFPEALHCTRTELHHPAWGCGSESQWDWGNKLPMVYMKNHYGMRKHKCRKTTKQVHNCLFQQLQIARRESVPFLAEVGSFVVIIQFGCKLTCLHDSLLATLQNCQCGRDTFQTKMKHTSNHTARGELDGAQRHWFKFVKYNLNLSDITFLNRTWNRLNWELLTASFISELELTPTYTP